MGRVYEYGTKFSNVITEDVIEGWNGENVILNGATGSGKTHWSENNLHSHCEKNFKNILFLCNRSALRDQINDEKYLKSLHNMDVMLYQTLQSKIGKKESIKKYNYIVCDEFHYVLTDAMFNVYTDTSYDWIVSNNESIKIFMSGTGNRVFNKLKNDGIVKEKFEYTIPYDYSYANMIFFKGKNKIYDIIDDILKNTNDKIIFFANSTEFAINVYKQFEKYSVFRCSKTSDKPEARAINNIECIKTYSDNLITFDNRLLITTKALDNGVNIMDKNLKHIICDVFDLESAQQCLGRKRIINSDDKCTFYIRNYSKKEIGVFKRDTIKAYTPVNMFVNDREKFNEIYNTDRTFHSDYIFYDDNNERKYNKLAYFKMTSELADMDLEETQGYKKVFLNRIGNTINDVKDLDEIEEYKLKSELELYLHKILDKNLYKEDREELIDKICLKDSRGRLQKSFACLSSYLQENFNLYIAKLIDKRRCLENGEKNINRDKTYWIIKEGKIVE